MAKPTKLPEWDNTEVNSVEPDTTHKNEGWLAPAGIPEKPPYQSFNWWQNSVWKWLNEVNIKGLLGWDNLTDYIANLSYVIGSDGNLYRCGINNGPSSSIVNPVGDGTGTWNDIINVTTPTARGYIDGLYMANGADADHDISMSPGICRDSSNVAPIVLTTWFQKQIDVNWAEGNDQGGFPSGLVLSVDTWYHIFIIMKADESQIDAGFDTSLTAVNLLGDATAYSLYRRIGSVLTDGSSNIIRFTQVGNHILWKNPPLDANALALTTTVTNITLSVPLGVPCICNINAVVNRVNAAYIYLFNPGIVEETAAIATAPLMSVGIDVDRTGNQVHILTNSTSQIKGTAVNSGTTTHIATLGWEDFRGRDA